jgi:hypothetical protein
LKEHDASLLLYPKNVGLIVTKLLVSMGGDDIVSIATCCTYTPSLGLRVLFCFTLPYLLVVGVEVKRQAEERKHCACITRHFLSVSKMSTVTGWYILLLPTGQMSLKEV